MANSKTKPDPKYLQDYRQRIGETIRENREKKGYSLDDLAEIMEITTSTISKIEKGKFAVSVDYIVKFGWYLDFDIAILERNRQSKSHTVSI